MYSNQHLKTVRTVAEYSFIHSRDEEEINLLMQIAFTVAVLSLIIRSGCVAPSRNHHFYLFDLISVIIISSIFVLHSIVISIWNNWCLLQFNQLYWLVEITTVRLLFQPQFVPTEIDWQTETDVAFVSISPSSLRRFNKIGYIDAQIARKFNWYVAIYLIKRSPRLLIYNYVARIAMCIKRGLLCRAYTLLIHS